MRFVDPDATMFAQLCRGYALVLQGHIAEGMALLDEAMVSVTADEVTPILAGIVYCQVIALCQEVFDLRRAREWTQALTRSCASQPDLVPFQGNCLVHRCEIFQLQGAWTDALDSARRACEWLAGPPACKRDCARSSTACSASALAGTGEPSSRTRSTSAWGRNEARTGRRADEPYGS